ncbi:Short-chain dehydrogenase/reductase SDR [Lasiodiplodia theobromae]|uniref:Short-chain dehydrogenase/reductase 3 n=1 Tax=Lasiodiplodia theobromae TaxID=45133 RepID=A0A5N5D2H2_9PEZI|nr:Dehydrogenase RED2 [Lasiodiplodia theobromae]KAF9634346.1 Short-chain dehydrogenase/reductase SDR [Lasiodiplodia theobromae]
MPLHSSLSLPREGFTIDVLGRILKHTALNPALTLPLLLLARFTQKGQGLTAAHPKLLKHVKTLLYLGLADRISAWLDRNAANNWTRDDTWDWTDAGNELVVVTGGSDGIGKEIVLQLAARGIRVAVLDIQAPTWSDDATDNLPTVYYAHCDLSSPPSIDAALADIRTHFAGREPTVLINNAGVCFGKPLLESSPQLIRKTFAVNTLAHFDLAQRLLPSMVARDHGMVVTVASQAAFVAAPLLADYAASKAAALALHEALAAELATVYNAPRVRTVAVCQNYTRTRLFEGFKEGDGWVNYTLHPQTVAEAVVGKVLGGESGLVVLPAAGWWVSAKVRGWPLWMQVGLRKRCVELMQGWKGRVVEQGREEEDGNDAGKEAGVGEEKAA